MSQVVLAVGQLAMPGEERRGRHGEGPRPAAARQEPCHRGEPHPVARLVRRRRSAPQSRAGTRATPHPSPVTTEHQDGQVEYTVRQQVTALEQHSASQPPLHPPCRRTAHVTHPIE
jgi:hypothetical protein